MTGNFVVIGIGRMGMNHIRSALDLGLSPLAICDVNAENLAKAIATFGLAENQCFSDLDKFLAFLENASIDLGIVATTSDVRCEIVKQLANHGTKAILCEKPMASSVEECDQMIRVCEEQNTRLAVNHQMRFMEAYTTIKSELETRDYGDLTSMNVIAGNIGIAMNGSHYFEAFKWLTGSEIQSASAWFSGPPIQSPRGERFFDQAGEARILSKDGHRLILNCGSDQGHGMTVTYAFNYGHIFIDELAGVYVSSCREKEFHYLPFTRFGMPSGQKTKTFNVADNVQPTKALINALLLNRSYPDGLSGKSSVATLAAIWKSAANNNQTVELNELNEYATNSFNWA